MKWPTMEKRHIVRGQPPPHYGVKGGGAAWRGTVERRDPAAYQQQADVGIRRCVGDWCRLWIGTDLTRCPHCHTRQT